MKEEKEALTYQDEIEILLNKIENLENEYNRLNYQNLINSNNIDINKFFIKFNYILNFIILLILALELSK